MIRHIIVYAAGNAAGKLLSFLLLPLFTRYLSPSDYAVYTMLAWVSLFATPIFSLGLGAGLGTVYFRADDAARRALVWNAVVVLAASAAVLVASAALFSREIGNAIFESAQPEYLVILSLASAGCSIVAMPLLLRLQLEGQAARFVTLNAVSSLGGAALAITAVAAWDRGVAGLVEAGFVAQLGLLAAAAVSSRPQLRGSRFDAGTARAVVAASAPFVPSFFLLFCLQDGNRFLLRHLGDDFAALGHYAVGLSLGLAISIPVAAFQTAWLPYFMELQKRGGNVSGALARALTYYALAAGSLGCLFFFFAKAVTMLMTQPEFLPAYRIIGFAAASQVFLGASQLFLPNLYYSREVFYVGLLQAGAVAVALACNWLLIPAAGAVGAAIALMLGMLALAAIFYLWNRYRGDRYLKIDYEWSRIGRFAATAAPLAAASLLDRDLGLAGEIAFAGGLALCLAVLALLQLGSEERRTLSAKLRWRGRGHE